MIEEHLAYLWERGEISGDDTIVSVVTEVLNRISLKDPEISRTDVRAVIIEAREWLHSKCERCLAGESGCPRCHREHRRGCGHGRICDKCLKRTPVSSKERMHYEELTRTPGKK